MEQERTKLLSKLQAESLFSQVFAEGSNASCYQCGKGCKQWAQTKHSIFLCLTCAAKFRDYGKFVDVKSVTLELWSYGELQTLKKGGNDKFRNYIGRYFQDNVDPLIIFQSKAAEYYRMHLLNPQQILLQNSPTLQNGITQADKPLTKMSADQILDLTKNTLIKTGKTAQVYGNKAYQTVSHKISSGEYKEDAKKAADTVAETAKGIWSFMSTKISQLSNKPK